MFIIRLIIILLWIALILSFLYAPKFCTSLGGEKVLNIFAWPDSLDNYVITKFEQKTGIRVNVSYYESNEELLVKLKATKGAGYDLIIPSDYTIDILRKKGLLKKFDKERMPFFKHFNPLLLHHYFDPENDYSLPLEWAVFGIGYDKDFFSTRPKPTWGLIFDPKLINYKIVMINDPLVAIPVAAYYLFHSIAHFGKKKLEAVKKLLIKQRSWIEAYSDFRADYLIATKNCPVVVSSSSYIWRSMRDFPHIGFLVPQEGTLITIESFAMPSTSTKDDLVYQFLSFLYDPEIVAHNFEKFGFFPTTLDVLDRLTLTPEVSSFLKMEAADFAKFDFLRVDDLEDGLTEQDLHDVWVAIKS